MEYDDEEEEEEGLETGLRREATETEGVDAMEEEEEEEEMEESGEKA